MAMSGRSTASVALTIAVLSSVASATDFRVSAFGTLGYARSSLENGGYLRYIDDAGTLKADSLFGVQGEAQFNAQWGATVQGVVSAPRTRDDGYEAKVRWAFLSFRPDNDWLIRVGRVRPPVFINTQNAEVGVTFDQVRLPVEIYSLSPVYDMDGTAVGKTWNYGGSEIGLDGYWGRADVKFRDHYQLEPPATYFPERITFRGLVISQTTASWLLRGGIHHGRIKADGFMYPKEYAAIPFPGPPPVGGTLYIPSGLQHEVDVYLMALGWDWRAEPWRVTFEYGKRSTPDSDIVVNDQSAYVTVSRRIHKWLPYVTYARMLSDSRNRQAYRSVQNTPVPLAAQGSPYFIPSNFHQMEADNNNTYDQSSVMIGASYSLSSVSVIKAEVMRTKVGLVSNLVDGNVHDRSFNVVSISYSFAF